MSSHLKTCHCGRRALPGSLVCALHPAPVVSEAQRLELHPYRGHYQSVEYQRNRLIAWRRCGGYCESCGRPITRESAECDHGVPVVDGGGDELDNLRWLCTAACHPEKTRKDRRRRAAMRRRG